ncbi:MAG: CHAT domain-containing tetratricopeptide repeat protein [bacterium]|nr:CHAT domain-containing tetratricopeptide repeat protein [bacterium]
MQVLKHRIHGRNLILPGIIAVLCLLIARPYLAGAYCKWLAGHSARQGNIMAAYLWNERGRSWHEKMLMAKRRVSARDSWKSGDFCYQIRQYWIANECYRRALHYIDESYVGVDYWKRNDEVLGSLSEAECGYRRLLDVRCLLLGDDDPETAAVHYALGRIYQRQGRYRDAVAAYTETLRIWEKSLGPRSPYLGHVLKSLGGVLIDLCQYDRAELYLIRAVDVYRNADDEGVRPWAQGPLSNLGSLYQTLGRGADAERTLLQALELNPRDRFTLDDLASVYVDQKRWAEAEEMYRRSLAVRREKLAKTHHEISWSLRGLAEVRVLQKDYPGAERYYRDAERIVRHSLGDDCADLASCWLGLAKVLHAQNEYRSAGSYYDRAIRLFEKNFGEVHPFVADALLGRAILDRDRQSLERARDDARRALAVRYKLFSDLFPVLSERNALLYSNSLRLAAGVYLSDLFALPALSDESNREIAAVVGSIKGMITDRMLARHSQWESSSDENVGARLDSLRAIQRALAQCYQRAHAQPEDGSLRDRLAELSETKDQLESELARTSRSDERKTAENGVSVEQVWDGLPDHSALLNYFRYEYPDVTGNTVAGYAVVVYTKDRDLRGVDLGTAQPIDSLVRLYRSHFEPPILLDTESYRKSASRLYHAICAPVDSILSQWSNLIIIPDGPLGLVSFATLVDTTGSYLIENHAVSYLTTIRDIIPQQFSTPAGAGLLVIADPLAHCANPQTDATVLGANLSGSTREANRAIAQWNRHHRAPAVLLAGKDATEKMFRQYCRGNYAIHMATHGYWDPASVRDQDRGARSPDARTMTCSLLHSGLVLGESCSREYCSDTTSDEDGILHAEEIASLDLRGTQLVVLTSCNSGIGDIEPGEGIYGLRRAFRLAGAQTIVCALWPIPDEATADLSSAMSGTDGESISESLREASLRYIRIQRQTQGMDHPLAWGALVVYGR